MPSPRSPLTALRVGALVLALTLTGAATSAAAFADDPTPTPAPGPTAGQTSSPAPSTAQPSIPATSAPATASPSPQVAQPRALAAAPARTVPSFCSIPAPGRATPYDSSYFNYPFSGTSSRNHIRLMVLNAIKSTPGCDHVDATTGAYTRNSIRIAAYAVNDNSTVDALIAAVRRGVVVQAVADSHLINGADHAQRSPSYKRLIRTLNYNTTDQSWAKVCNHSCRGTAGNHHYKMYLFSQTGAKRNVTMAGSANLTMKASAGQWNHLDVYTSAKTYATYANIFTELGQDRLARGQYRDYTTDAVRTWFFPRPGTKYWNDPMVAGLSKIGCTGSGYGNGRTVVRIGMYAWYEERGLWMAKKVRQLWNAGCNVAIEYAVMGNNVKKIVYSPAGRGRIPMRQVATYYRDGSVADYDHQKYVTVQGRYAGRSRSVITWTGSTNWSNLGFYSDDLTQVWSGDAKRAAAYRGAFYRVWRGPHTRVPSPTSKLPGKVGKGAITFGKGKYRNLEAN